MINEYPCLTCEHSIGAYCPIHRKEFVVIVFNDPPVCNDWLQKADCTADNKE